MPNAPSNFGEGCFQEDLGVWIRTSRKPYPQQSPALFLDRDGVIVEDPGYLHEPARLKLISGAAQFIGDANRRRIPVIAVTNQSGIGRGYYAWSDFINVENALTHILAHSEAALDAVLACPIPADGDSPTGSEHGMRKPGPGMLLIAASILNLDLTRSWIIGDRMTDLRAGHNAGLRGGFHVLTGEGAKERPAIGDWKPKNFDLRFADSIGQTTMVFDYLG